MLTTFQALPIQTTVFDDIAATDLDANKNKEIVFSILSGNTYVSVCHVFSWPINISVIPLQTKFEWGM